MATSPADQDLFTPTPLPVAELDDAGRLACLRLLRSTNIGPVAFRELINQYGGAVAALKALPGIAARSPGGRRSTNCPQHRAEQELEAARRIGATPLFTIEPDYPAALAALDQPPPLLYVKGRSELLNSPMLAVVGSRKASAAGLKLARQFSAALANATIAVVAGGLDVIYPPEHEDLQKRIAERGCIISEMPPGFRPRGNDFPRRNRIIAGISHGVLVIEAAKKSGTLSTARRAADFGREVFAVPGHPLDPRAAGANALLKSGATLVVEPQDVLDALEPLTGDIGDRFSVTEAAAEFHPAPAMPPLPPQDGAVEAVRDALGPHPVEVDEIARATGLSIRDVRILLIDLDLHGVIERHGNQLVSLKPVDTGET